MYGWNDDPCIVRTSFFLFFVIRFFFVFFCEEDTVVLCADWTDVIRSNERWSAAEELTDKMQSSESETIQAELNALFAHIRVCLQCMCVFLHACLPVFLCVCLHVFLHICLPIFPECMHVFPPIWISGQPLNWKTSALLVFRHLRGHPFMTFTKIWFLTPHLSRTPFPLWTSTCGRHETHIALLKRLGMTFRT